MERIEEWEKYLKPTPMIDCDHGTIQEKANEVTKGQEGVIEKSRALFAFVRDGIKYNPYLPRYLPEHFRASNTLAREEGFCVQKAVLLVALSRVMGIPSRLGFAVIKNYLLPEKVAEMLVTNLLPDHGYAELYLNGKWIKATPTFDLEMCQKNRIVPVEFNGKDDAKFHSHTQDGKLHIEYILDRGPYEDVPLDGIRKWLIPVLKPEAKSIILGIKLIETHLIK
jgi:transglutaminase-like putative cysteine protease